MAVKDSGQDQIPEELLRGSLFVGETEALLFGIDVARTFVMFACNALRRAGVHIDDHAGFFHRCPYGLVFRFVITAVFNSRWNLHAAETGLGILADIRDRMLDVQDR